MQREVETRFTARDENYSSTLGRITQAFRAGHGALGQFQHKLADFRREQGFTTLQVLGLGVGIGALVHKAKEAVSEFTGVQKGVAAVLARNLSFERGASELDRFKRSMVLAKDIANEIDEMSARFVMPMSEIDSIYRKLAISAGALGLTQKQVLELTTSTAAAAKVHGVSGEQAATTIARALTMKTVRGVDDFSLSMRRALGNMKGLSQEKIFERVEKGLAGSRDIADAMSGGISGALARIRNVVEDTFRDLSMPLFKEVARRLEEWGKHLRTAKENGKPLIEVFSGRLLDVFKKLADLAAFIKSHWLAVAAVVGGLKLPAMLAEGGKLAGLAGLGGGAAGGFLMKVSTISVIAGTAYIGGKLIGDLIGGKIEETVAERGKNLSIAQQLSLLNTVQNVSAGQPGLNAFQERILKGAVQRLEKEGLITVSSTGQRSINRDALREFARTNQDSNTAEVIRKVFGGREDADPLTKSFNPQVGGRLNVREKLMKQMLDTAISLAGPGAVAPPKVDDTGRSFSKPPKIEINGGLHVKMNLETDDPDRVFIRFREGVEDLVMHKTQSVLAEPLGD